MIEAHLPVNLFEAMACEDYEDESNHAFARACGLVVEMGAKDVEPNNATFRCIKSHPNVSYNGCVDFVLYRLRVSEEALDTALLYSTSFLCVCKV